MKKYIRRYFSTGIFVFVSGVMALGQTPQEQYTLSSQESGTKNYKARYFIKISPGFSYKAASGSSTLFRASIDPSLRFPHTPGTNPDWVNPDGTNPDGTNPDGRYPDGTYPTDNGTTTGGGSSSGGGGQTGTTTGTTTGAKMGVVATPAGIPNPLLWFKTVPVTNDLSGLYRWRDFSKSAARVLKYNTAGATIGTEYTQSRDKIKVYNFNPAITLSGDNVSKEIAVKRSNLDQASFIGVWRPQYSELSQDKFLFALNGAKGKGMIVTRSKVVSSIESGSNVLQYGVNGNPNMVYQSSEINTNLFREHSLRTGAFFKANQPAISIWDQDLKSVISMGSYFKTDNVNNKSTYNTSLFNNVKFDGYSPEFIVFDRIITPLEQQELETYLALKYGISLLKSYIMGSRLLWDFNASPQYNNRISGYGRNDQAGFSQTISSSSYQEKPYFNDSLIACNFYTNNSSYEQSSPYKLLVVGREPGNSFSNNEYVIYGDNNDSLTFQSGVMQNVKLMKRKWKLRTTKANSQSDITNLEWNMNGIVLPSDNSMSTIRKQNTLSTSSMVTKVPLKEEGAAGYLGWTASNVVGPIIAKFGEYSSGVIGTGNDYGFSINSSGQVFIIRRGVKYTTPLDTIHSGERVEVEKKGNFVWLRVNGVKNKNTEIQIEKTDTYEKYYGAVVLPPNNSDISLLKFRHGGFVNTGHRIELSYFNNMAKELSGQQIGNCYLYIDRTGSNDFTREQDLDKYQMDELDQTRSKIIFNNVSWDSDDGELYFTFGYQAVTPNLAPEGEKKVIKDSTQYNDAHLRVFYRNIRDMSKVTVSLKQEHPSPSTIVVFDISGRMIYKEELPAREDTQEVDIRMPQSGIYIVKVITREREYSTKVICKI